MSRPVPPRVLSSLALTCLIIAGCELFTGSDDSADTSLTDVVWKLDSIENAGGDVIFHPDPARTYQVTFEEDGSLTARNACNACTGHYENAESTLSIAASCTESACGTPAPYLGYGNALTSANTYVIRSGKLYIHFVDRDGNEQSLVHVAEQE